MAQFNMRYAAEVVGSVRELDPDAFAALCRRTGLDDHELEDWRSAADAMYLPYDGRLGINPQDDVFLEREPWPFDETPDERYPLLLNFHPLVIYRHQVLKQADVVLAMFLRGDAFATETKRANFDYYDPITTGDSSLSACVQSIVAAEVGHEDLSWDYFLEALYVDLGDTHGNASDGVHIASTGGVWSCLAFGFSGMRDDGTALSFAPHLPAGIDRLRLRLTRHGSRCVVQVDRDGATIEVADGRPVQVRVDGHDGVVTEASVGQPVRVA